MESGSRNGERQNEKVSRLEVRMSERERKNEKMSRLGVRMSERWETEREDVQAWSPDIGTVGDRKLGCESLLLEKLERIFVRCSPEFRRGLPRRLYLGGWR